jgi:hypothetical protein
MQREVYNLQRVPACLRKEIALDKEFFFLGGGDLSGFVVLLRYCFYVYFLLRGAVIKGWV